jgi:hypothetical protein
LRGRNTEGEGESGADDGAADESVVEPEHVQVLSNHLRLSRGHLLSRETDRSIG